MEITGLSMAARAIPAVDPREGKKVLRMLAQKHPPQGDSRLAMPTPADVRIFRVHPHCDFDPGLLEGLRTYRSGHLLRHRLGSYAGSGGFTEQSWLAPNAANQGQCAKAVLKLVSQ